MSKSIEEMNLKEFIEYFEGISGIVGVDFDDDNLATRTLHFLKEYEGVAAVKTYTQEELNEAITKALNDMNTVLSTKDKKNELYKQALKEAFEEIEVYKKALGLACNHWSDLEEAVEECGIEIKYHIYSPLPRDRKVEVYLNKAREQNDEGVDSCPRCGNHLYIGGAYRMKYCCDCGQAIDWDGVK